MTWRDGHNPVGVGKLSRRLPRVARASQPWALCRNPVGIRPAAFAPGKHGRVAVKIVDDRGIESLKILEIA